MARFRGGPRVRSGCVLAGTFLALLSGARAGAWAQDLVASGEVPELVVGELPFDLQLDGRLDEPAWQRADVISGLTMVEPSEGIEPTQRTEVRVMAGPRTLVIGVICLDEIPAAIVSYSKARDAELRREDHVTIVIDTFRDGRSGYVFSTNPSGARYDALVTNRGEGENSSWDEIWEAAAQIDAHGWSVEIRIPVRSLRFDASLTAWGFNIERRVERLQEVSRWSGTTRDYEVTQTSRSGLITGLPRLNPGIGLSVTPSLVGSAGYTELGGASELNRDPSLDVTQLLGSSLLGSLTANTDFAETEVDARRTNLTRFPLFFPEKRSFFLQGADIFDFGIGLRRDLLPFFSRRIGLVQGQEVPVRVGLKANGRVGNTNIGALVTRTGAVNGVVPSTNIGVIRLQQNVLAESSVGIIGTVGDPLGRSGAWTAGADFTFQTSRFRGDKNLLIGAWALSVGRDDLPAGSKSAYGLRIDYPNDIWDLSLTYKRIGEAFGPSLGFVPRTGVQIIDIGADRNVWPRTSWLRNFVIEFNSRFVTDLQGRWESYRVFTAPINVRFQSGDRFELNWAPTGERIDEPFEIADGVVIAPGQYSWTRYRIEASAAPKRPVSGQITWWFGGFYGGTLDQIELELSWNPSDLINVELSAERDIGHLPAGDFTLDLAMARVALNLSSDLQVSSLVQYDNESRSLGSNSRLRWTFSPVGELFAIYNYNVVDLMDRWRADTNQLTMKVRYTLRR